MILSGREKRIGWVTVAVFFILFGDRFLAAPYFERKNALVSEKHAITRDLRNARNITAKWKELTGEKNTFPSDGLDRRVREADLSLIKNWAEEAGMKLSLLRPEGKSAGEKLDEEIFLVAGTGQMRNVSMFLWKIESSSLPVKIKDMQLTSRRDGADDLSLQVRVGRLSDDYSLRSEPEQFNEVGSETEGERENE